MFTRVTIHLILSEMANFIKFGFDVINFYSQLVENEICHL